MKFTLPTLIALFAALPAYAEDPPRPASEELANPVKVVSVTQWEQGEIGGVEAAGLEPTVLVNGKNYKEMWAQGPSKDAVGLSPFFIVKRDVWGDYHYFCDVTMTEDPGVPIVHVIFEDKDGELHAFANGHEDTVKVECGDKLENWKKSS